MSTHEIIQITIGGFILIIPIGIIIGSIITKKRLKKELREQARYDYYKDYLRYIDIPERDRAAISLQKYSENCDHYETDVCLKFRFCSDCVYRDVHRPPIEGYHALYAHIDSEIRDQEEIASILDAIENKEEIKL